MGPGLVVVAADLAMRSRMTITCLFLNVLAVVLLGVSYSGGLSRRKFMTDHVYKKVEIVGSSTESIADAVKTGIAKASESVHNMRWFEVSEIRGEIEEGKVAHFQVTMKVGFTVEE